MNQEKWMPYLLLAPLAVLFLLPLVASLVILVVQSLGYIPALGLEHMTFKAYAAVWKDKMFLDAFLFSMWTSTISALLAVFAGFVMAYAIMGARESVLFESVIRIPVLIPHFTAAFLAFLIFSQSGEVSRLFGSIGLLKDQALFPELVFDKAGWGIILSFVWKEAPFAALVLYSTMKTIGSRFLDTASNLGASAGQYVLNILMPLCRPAALSTFALLFAFNFGAFEVPYLVGPSYPKTLSVLGYLSYLSPDIKNRPETMAVNLLITAICLMALYAYDKALKAVIAIKTPVGGRGKGL